MHWVIVEVCPPLGVVVRCFGIAGRCLRASGLGTPLLRGGPVGRDGGAGPPAAGSLQASSIGFAVLAASRADAAVS